MCGIFGIINVKNNNIYKLIINGLTQLQNRGYDSCGLSVLYNNDFDVYKFASTNEINAIDKLDKLIIEECQNKISNIGLGHNRWATHGIKNDINAHPHLSNNKKFIVVHNGIIENYNKLKIMLIDKGFTFLSQTDTEVIVNLIEYYYSITGNTENAIKKTINDLSGTYGLIIQSLYEPTKLFCVRNGSPLLVGYDEEIAIITSEQSGFCNLINNYIILNNDDICIIEKINDKISMITNCTYSKKNTQQINYEVTPYPYNHWTIKEIFDQPNTILNSINNGGRIKNNSEVKLGGLENYSCSLKNIKNLILLGCGTSYFSGLYGMYYFKNICNFNTVQVYDGAEFNENDIPKIGETAFILISQSGETKDLYHCINIAKKNNIITIGIINVVDSLLARDVECGIYCNAGKEHGVASTKSFTSQVVCLCLAAVWFSQLHNINENKRIKIISDLHNLSNDIKNTINNCNEKIKEISDNLNFNNMFLLGKGSDEFIAKEGSLKLKEISYIHAEGYSSSSLKHGPFALLDQNFPVIIFNLDQIHKTKTINCYKEIESRNAPIIFITNDYTIKNEINCDIIFVSENKSFASLLGIIPIQLLSYYLSINKNINPDKPKNLAKVVTVE